MVGNGVNHFAWSTCMALDTNATIARLYSSTWLRPLLLTPIETENNSHAPGWSYWFIVFVAIPLHTISHPRYVVHEICNDRYPNRYSVRKNATRRHAWVHFDRLHEVQHDYLQGTTCVSCAHQNFFQCWFASKPYVKLRPYMNSFSVTTPF